MLTAGFILAAAVFAGCAFNSLNYGVAGVLSAPAASAKVENDETTAATETEAPGETSEETTSEETTSEETTSEETVAEDPAIEGIER